MALRIPFSQTCRFVGKCMHVSSFFVLCCAVVMSLIHYFQQHDVTERGLV